VIALPHGGGGSGSESGSSGASSGDAARSLAAPETAPSGAAPSAAVPFAGRKVERTTDLTVGVAPSRLQAAAQRVYALVGEAGGIVDSSSVSSGGGSGTASFALRIPAGRLDRTVTQLAALGRVRSQTSGTQDITASFASVAERLRGALAERRGILRALGRATTQAQLDALRERRRIVDGEIAGLRRERAGLRRRTSYGRVSLDLVTNRSGVVPVGSGHDRWAPGDALADAGRILAVAAGVAILVLALALPAAALAALGWAAARPLRRRRRESALRPA
jgi:hypothetical protein